MMNTIQEELKQGATIAEVCNKHHLTFKELVDEMTNLPYKRGKTLKSTPQYIYRYHKRYLIGKIVNGVWTRFGTYESIEEAVKVRDELIKNDWLVGDSHVLGDSYIYPSGKHYKIRKRINGVFKYLGSFKTLEDARKVRDKLVDFGWDESYLKLICKNLGVDIIEC